jgi:thiol-disulfide isomerase/thioredoxin
MDFMGIEMKSSRRIIFKTIRINEPVPDSVFSFVPPKNALEVEEVIPPGGSRTKTLGKDAPGLALASVDGTKTDIKDLRGKTMLLYVWATWCVPCRDTSAIVKKVDSQFKEKGLVVLAVNCGEEKKRW